MMKSYSRKEREIRKLIRSAIVIFLVAILVIIAATVLIDTNDAPQYTEEQMKHDHNLDGIPDH